MELATITYVLDELKRRPATELETQTREFKGWCKDPKELSDKIIEAAVCLANTDGGLIFVGVDDQKRGEMAISRCPHPSLTADWIKMRIRDFTRPPVQCSVIRLDELVPSISGTPAADVFVLDIRKKTQPSGHMTHWGVSLVRVDTQCRTEYLVDNDDYTAMWLDHLTFRAVDELSIQSAITKRQATYSDIKYLGHDPIDHLMGLGLLRLKKEGSVPSSESLTPSIGALLLLGKAERIKAELPSAETTVAIEIPVMAPFTSSNWYNIVDSVDRYVGVITSHLQPKDIQIPSGMLRELLVNAYLHRCYRSPGPVQIRIREGELEIQNPGGLLGGLTVDTLVWGPAYYRNFVLSDAARQFGFCEKAGMGIKKVYYQSILDGLEFPMFHSDINHFSVVIKTKKDDAFAKFIKATAGGLGLQLSELMILRALRSREELEVDPLAKLAQRRIETTEAILRDLQRRNLIGKSKARYKLTDAVLDEIAKYENPGQLKLFSK
jgi:ATP-dependent DNA helicase RecG